MAGYLHCDKCGSDLHDTKDHGCHLCGGHHATTHHDMYSDPDNDPGSGNLRDRLAANLNTKDAKRGWKLSVEKRLQVIEDNLKSLDQLKIRMNELEKLVISPEATKRRHEEKTIDSLVEQVQYLTTLVQEVTGDRGSETDKTDLAEAAKRRHEEEAIERTAILVYQTAFPHRQSWEDISTTIKNYFRNKARLIIEAYLGD